MFKDFADSIDNALICFGGDCVHHSVLLYYLLTFSFNPISILGLFFGGEIIRPEMQFRLPDVLALSVSIFMYNAGR